MIYNNALCFMYIIEIILIFLSHTFAPWNSDTIRFKQANASMLLNCENWLLYYDFKADDVNENIRLALDVRDKRLDGEIFIYAALYAHMLVAFSDKYRDSNFSPNVFCSEVAEFNDQRINFRKLKESQKKCEEWINLHGYTNDNLGQNKDSAIGRDIEKDGEISLWAAGYGRYLARESNEGPISPRGFCDGLQLLHTDKLFMNFDVTIMTCADWIELSGYDSDDVRGNMERAKHFIPSFLNFTNEWTKMYVEHLTSFTSGPKKICYKCCGKCFKCLNGPEVPYDFCHKKGFTSLVRVNYTNISSIYTVTNE